VAVKILKSGFMHTFTFCMQREFYRFEGVTASEHSGVKSRDPSELDRESVLTFCDGRSARLELCRCFDDMCGGSIGVMSIERMAEEVCLTHESCQSHDNR
jgi:hypothetical protein